MPIILRRLNSTTSRPFIPVSNYKFYDAVVKGHVRYRKPLVYKGNTDHGNMISTKEMLSEFLGTDSSPSRFNPGTPTVIAGVTVPAKPIEPTNCCQSGCINCVWEIFNDDVMEWQTAREKAVAALEAKGGTWPEGIEPPSSLKPQNMSNTMHQESKKFGPKLQKKPVVPVGMSEFAAMEKRIKKRQQER